MNISKYPTISRFSLTSSQERIRKFIIRYFPVREIALQTSGFHHHRQKLKMRNISGITGIPGFISRFHWLIQKSGSISSCYLYKNDILRNRKYE